MRIRNQINDFWANSSKKLKYLIFMLIGFAIYSIFILIFIPNRYYRSGRYLPGLSGWEFGLLILLLYIFLTTVLLEPPIKRNNGGEKAERIKINYKNLIFLNIFLFLAMNLLLFATQMLENLIAVYKCGTDVSCNKNTSGWLFIYNIFAGMGLEHKDVLYMVWTFSGVLFIACFIFFGIAVDYAKRKEIFKPSGLNSFNYLFWVNVLLGSTGWMYIAWFSLTDFDLKMWSAIANGETWGYFSLGIVGVFFNSVPELIFMISVSCSLVFINFYVLKKYIEI
jgi:hypothetical protein